MGDLASQVPGALHAIAAETGGTPRRGQDAMAVAVAHAIEDRQAVAIEAPTGSGKARAGTLPFLMRGDRKLIVSTGTRALQDQYDNDLPTIVKHLVAMGYPRKLIAVLKGRANYPCKLACDSVLTGEYDGDYSHTVERVAKWAMNADLGTEWGDAPRPVSLPDRVALSAGPDECLGKRCRFYNDCHSEEARRKAKLADLVVVNHALLCANIAYGGQLIPIAADHEVAFLVDEVQLLESAAENIFGTYLTFRQANSGAEFGHLVDIGTGLHKLGISGEYDPMLPADLLELSRSLRYQVDAALKAADTKELPVGAELKETLAADMSQLKSLVRRAARGLARFEDDRYGTEPDSQELAVKRIASKLDRAEMVHSAMTSDAPAIVNYLERAGRAVRLVATDLDIGPKLRDGAWLVPFGEPRTVVLASATIPAGYMERIGLPWVQPLRLTSPFDLANRQLTFVADSLPSPSKARASWEAMAPAVAYQFADAALETGSVLVLCTSWKMVSAYRAALAPLRDARPDLQFCIDSDEQLTSDVVERFAKADRAVLISAQGAWTGIDLPGKVRCVIVPAVPMPVPGRPVNEARKALWPSRFKPHPMDRATAAMMLAQGFGRLMRDRDDWGACVVLDPRVLWSNYATDLRANLQPGSLILRDSHRAGALDWLRSGGPR